MNTIPVYSPKEIIEIPESWIPILEKEGIIWRTDAEGGPFYRVGGGDRPDSDLLIIERIADNAYKTES